MNDNWILPRAFSALNDTIISFSLYWCSDLKDFLIGTILSFLKWKLFDDNCWSVLRHCWVLFTNIYGDITKESLQNFLTTINEEWSAKLFIYIVTWILVFIVYYIAKMINVLFLIAMAWIVNIIFNMKYRKGRRI